MTRAILFGQGDEPPVDQASLAPRVIQQHRGEQTPGLRLVGHQVDEEAAEPDRLGGEVGTLG